MTGLEKNAAESEMVSIRSFKMTHKSNKFNKNQRVFIIFATGSLAWYCYGKFRGRFRWVKAWVRGGNETHPEPTIQEFDIRRDSHIARECYLDLK